MRGPKASVSRWATPGGGLVEAEDPGVEGEQAGQLDDPAGPGRELGDEVVGVAPEAEEVHELLGVGSLAAVLLEALRAGRAPSDRKLVRWRASRAIWIVSRTDRSGNSRADLERAAEADGAARLCGARWLTSSPRSSTCPVLGT